MLERRLIDPITLGPFESVLGGDAAQPDTLSHSLILQPHPGTASRMVLKISSKENVRLIQAIVVVDGSLLIVPIAWAPQVAAYQADVPTPQKSFDYQFQVNFASGRNYLTKWFSVAGTCFERNAEELIQTADQNKRPLLRELLDLDRQIAQASVLVESLDQIGAYSK